MTRRVIAAVLLALLTAGCGAAAQDEPQVASADTGRQNVAADDQADGQAGTEDGPAVADEDRVRRFAACMRDNGVDMPDPEPGGPVRIGIGAGNAGSGDREAMEKATEACRQYLPNGGERPELSPEDLEKARAMAACMRENGVDVPDPDAGTGGGIVMRRGESAAPADREVMEKALEACRHLGPGRLRVGGGR